MVLSSLDAEDYVDWQMDIEGFGDLHSYVYNYMRSKKSKSLEYRLMNTVILLYQKSLDRLQGYDKIGTIINIKT